jgi:hypothetical protein
MLRRILSLFGLGLLISPSCLHADTITTFALDGFTFLETPASLTGTVTVDVTTGIVTGINATYTAGSLTDVFTVVQASSPPPMAGEYAFMQSINISTKDSLFFTFPISSLSGYAGGPVCFYYIAYPYGTCPVPGPFDPPMAYYVSQFIEFPMFENIIKTGTLDPISTTTPEPSTFLLVGSGLIGILTLSGPLRRKFYSCP